MKFDPILKRMVPGGGSSKPVVYTTYLILDSLRLASGLTVGQEYSLKSVTKYFQSTSAKLKVGKYDYATLTPEELADAEEEIILTATSTSTFDSKARSMKFAGDIVYFDFYDTTVEIKGYVGEFAEGNYFSDRLNQIVSNAGEYYQCIQNNAWYPDITDTDYFRPLGFTDADLTRQGWIYKRVSGRGNETGFDFRNMTWARAVPDFKQWSEGDPMSPAIDIPQFYNATKQKFTLDFTGINNYDLQSKYFEISSLNVNYYVWFNDADYTTVDPEISGRTPIQIDYDSSYSTLPEIVGIVASTLNTYFYPEFSTITTGDVLEIENFEAGVMPDPTAGDTGAVLTLLVDGANNYTEAGKLYQYTDPGQGGQNIIYCGLTTNNTDPTNPYYFAPIYRRNEWTGATGYFYQSDAPMHFMQLFGLSKLRLSVDYTDYQEYYSLDDGSMNETSDTNYKNIVINNVGGNKMPNFVIKGGGEDSRIGSYITDSTIAGSLYRVKAPEITECYFGTYFQRYEIVGGNFGGNYFFTALSNGIMGGMNNSYYSGYGDNEVRNLNSLDYIDGAFCSGTTRNVWMVGYNGSNINLGSIVGTHYNSLYTGNFVYGDCNDSVLSRHESMIYQNGLSGVVELGNGVVSNDSEGVIVGPYCQSANGGVVIGNGASVIGARSFGVGRAYMEDPTRGFVGSTLFGWRYDSTPRTQKYRMFNELITSLGGFEALLDATRTVITWPDLSAVGDSMVVAFRKHDYLRISDATDGLTVNHLSEIISIDASVGSITLKEAIPVLTYDPDPGVNLYHSQMPVAIYQEEIGIQDRMFAEPIRWIDPITLKWNDENVLTSPNLTKWKITVDDSGILSTTAL